MPGTPLADAGLFDLPDELFVSEAYLRVLGRPADPRGYLGYVAGLRRRLSRPGLIRELQRSPEWKGDVASPARGGALQVAPELWPAGRRQRHGSILARPDRDILDIEGSLFVRTACWMLLGRDPTDEELTAWLKRSANRIDRKSLLADVGAQGQVRRRGPPVRVAAPMAARSTTPAAPGGADAGVDGKLQGTAVFTIATRSYLPFVRALMQSLRQHHADLHLFLLLVDEPEPPLVAEDWTTVAASALGLPHFDDMSVRYDVLELSTALKPFFVLWLLEHTQLTNLIYLDPDIQVHAPLQAVRRALDGGASMVLTPHSTLPLDDGAEPGDHTILKSGAFNLGFLAVRRAASSIAFLRWWSERLRTGGLVAFERNLFTDQRWCDLAPALVPDLAILRDDSCNVAYWNLPHRRVQRDGEGRWSVNGEPLCFFHFSGFDPQAPQRLSKYQTRPLVESNDALRDLLASYAQALLAADWHMCRARPYAYAEIEGVPLSASLRRIFGDLHPAGTTLSRAEALAALLAECRSADALPPLARRIHAMRPDLQGSFDLDAPAGRSDFEGWFWSTGVVEHGLVGLLRRARASEVHKG